MRTPLRPGIAADRLVWEDLAPAALAALAPLVERIGPHLQTVGPAGTRSPRYVRGIAGNGRPLWFAKIVREAELPKAGIEAELTRSLAVEGVAVSAVIAEVDLADGAQAHVHDWVPGRHPAAGATDFEGLGAAVSAFHAALGRVAERFGIPARAEERLRDLERIARSPLFDRCWTGSEYRTFAYAMREAFLAHLDAIRTLGAAIHGDLNPGNIIVREDAFVFLDLEDALHSHLWPGLDLAKVAERLILPVAGDDPALARMNVAALCRGYGFDDRRRGGPSIPDALRWQTGLAILVMTSEAGSGSAAVRSEMAKFATLEGWLQQHQAIFRTDAG